MDRRLHAHHPEHPVADRETVDPVAERFDGAREIAAEHRWELVRHVLLNGAGRDERVVGVERSRGDADEYLADLDDRIGDLDHRG